MIPATWLVACADLNHAAFKGSGMSKQRLEGTN